MNFGAEGTDLYTITNVTAETQKMLQSFRDSFRIRMLSVEFNLEQLALFIENQASWYRKDIFHPASRSKGLEDALGKHPGRSPGQEVVCDIRKQYK